MTPRELDTAQQDLEWWQKVFDHMPDWVVCGWTYRLTVQVFDREQRRYINYTCDQVEPILALKGIEKPNIC